VLLRVASDARLVALIRDGRSPAFEAAYDRHHPPILSFCMHMLGDMDEAEDAAQQTFTTAYSELIASRQPVHLRAWLFTIARNRCLTILRQRRAQPVAEMEEVLTDGLAAQVQAREDLRELVSDIQLLPEEQRAALALAELGALSHAEIAEALGVPREKVKSLVFQARESLIASRAARETTCAEIRAQLASGRGAVLRRSNLRRHLRQCDGCREFRAEVTGQRRRLAALLLAVPTVALKQAVLGGSVAGGAIGAGALAPSALKSAAAKGMIGALLAGAGTAGTVVVAGEFHIGGLEPPAAMHHVRADAEHSQPRPAPGLNRSTAWPVAVTKIGTPRGEGPASMRREIGRRMRTRAPGTYAVAGAIGLSNAAGPGAGTGGRSPRGSGSPGSGASVGPATEGPARPNGSKLVVADAVIGARPDAGAASVAPSSPAGVLPSPGVAPGSASSPSAGSSAPTDPGAGTGGASP